MDKITFSTSKQFEVVDITKKVEKIVGDRSPGSDAVCFVYTPHATGAVVVNEGWDKNIGGDLLKALDELVPLRNDWKHDRIDGNAAAHIKSAILGPSEHVPIRDGKLKLGRWQNIFFVESDGPRDKRFVYVKIVKD